MLILATEEFSQAVYLASGVSEPNKTALCCIQLSAAHLHTHTLSSCSAWRVSGYLGNLSMKYTAYPLVTVGAPDSDMSGSHCAE